MILIVFLLFIFALLVFFSSKFLSASFSAFLFIIFTSLSYLLFGLGSLTDTFWLVFVFLGPLAWATLTAFIAALMSIPALKKRVKKLLNSGPLHYKHPFEALSGIVILLTIGIHLFFYRPVYLDGLIIKAESPGASGTYYQVDLEVEADGELIEGPSVGLTAPKVKITKSDAVKSAYDLSFTSYGKVIAIIRFFPAQGAESPSFEVVKAEPGSIL